MKTRFEQLAKRMKVILVAENKEEEAKLEQVRIACGFDKQPKGEFHIEMSLAPEFQKARASAGDRTVDV